MFGEIVWISFEKLWKLWCEFKMWYVISHRRRFWFNELINMYICVNVLFVADLLTWQSRDGWSHMMARQSRPQLGRGERSPRPHKGTKAKGGVHIIRIINTDGPKGQAEKDSQARGRNKEQEWAKVTPSFKSPGKIPYDRRRQCRQSCTRVLTLSGTLEN